MQEIISNIIVAVLASGLTYFLAIEKFRSEKWWELKFLAYQKIIEALHKAKEYSSQHHDVELGIKMLSEEKKAILKADTLLGSQEIAKAIDVGSFITSEEAVLVLDGYRNDMDSLNSSTNSWFEYLDDSYGLTKDCLDKVKLLAKKDLQRSHVLFS